ncbi:MAG TPA: hypothetical protein VMI47_11050 [Pseudolabrys sp.]|nr:hypothetical protein [Pseudolabrys sp.]
MAARVKALERERAFAFRRFNLMRSIADAIAGAESEEIAVAAATAVLRTKLGWSSDSDARAAVLSRFTPVAQAMFASLAPPQSGDGPPPDVVAALGEFERWYAESHPNLFWILFENYMPETPVVDF